MPFQLHDTLTSTTVPLPMRTPGEVSIYVCGPTVYNYIHVGNARPAVVFDVLVRHLRASGLKVKFVRNFTDVDDKIIKAAALANEEPAVLTERYIDAYLEDTQALNCRRPDIEPRVSKHMPEIIAMIETLIAKGNAYVRDGDVYFAVRTFAGYGKLSKRDLDGMRSGERVAVDERKQDPLDFALWKSAKPHEPSGARWASPWGEGRPGWHIECSAMARKYLGDGFDLHGGGIDLIFPHHENEIAQSECATGLPFAHTWMHNGFINVNDTKMAKSDLEKLGERGKYFLLRNLLPLVEPEAVRFWLLSTHYRMPLNFELATDDAPLPAGATPVVRFPGIEEAEKRIEYFYETKARLLALIGRASMTPAGKWVASPDAELRKRFDTALDDDLNTSAALAPMADAYKRANELCDGSSKDTARVRALLETLDHMSDVLGVAEGDPENFFDRVRARRIAARGLDAAEIEGLVASRTAAREAKDFGRADVIRKELLSRGIEIRDTPGSASSWRVIG